ADPESRPKLATLIIGGITVMSISLIALLTFAGPKAAVAGIAVVLFGLGSLLFLWRRSQQGRSEQRPTPPPDRDGERRTRIATGVIAAIAVVAVAMILWLLDTRRSDATGGPVMVIVTGVLLMALAATHGRF